MDAKKEKNGEVVILYGSIQWHPTATTPQEIGAWISEVIQHLKDEGGDLGTLQIVHKFRDEDSKKGRLTEREHRFQVSCHLRAGKQKSRRDITESGEWSVVAS